MSAHTPPPWHIGAANEDATIVYDAHDEPIAWCEHSGLYQQTDASLACDAANAKLMAAAPDLFEALREAENALADYIPSLEKHGASLNYGHSVMRKARTALAKAGVA